MRELSQPCALKDLVIGHDLTLCFIAASNPDHRTSGTTSSRLNGRTADTRHRARGVERGIVKEVV